MKNQFKKICFLTLSQVALLTTPDLLEVHAMGGDDDFEIEDVEEPSMIGSLVSSTTSGLPSVSVSGSGGYTGGYSGGYSDGYTGGSVITSDQVVAGEVTFSDGQSTASGVFVKPNDTSAIKTNENANVSIALDLTSVSGNKPLVTAANSKFTIPDLKGDVDKTLAVSGTGTTEITSAPNFEGTVSATNTNLNVNGDLRKATVALASSTMTAGNGSEVKKVVVGTDSSSTLALEAGATSTINGLEMSGTSQHPLYVTFSTGSTLNLKGLVAPSSAFVIDASGGGTMRLSDDNRSFLGQISASGSGTRVNLDSTSQLAPTSVLSMSSGATLSGVGSAGRVVVGNGGVWAPGNSPGTMSATHATFNTGSTFQACIGINSSGNRDNSKVVATDSLTIADGATARITMSNDSSHSTTPFTFSSNAISVATILEGPSTGIIGNFSKVYVPQISGIEGWVYTKTSDGKLIVKAINYGSDVIVDPSDYSRLNADTNVMQAVNADDLGSTTEAADLGFQHITAPFNTNNDFSSSGVAMQDFVSRPKLVNYNNNTANFEQMLQAASESGPVSVTTKQGNLEKRVWLTPMINKSAVSTRAGAAGSRGFAGGFLAGAELRGGKGVKWIVGMMTGYVGSKNTGKDNRDNYLKNTGIHAGLYNRVDYGDHWQHEIVASRIFFDNKLSRYDSPAGADPKIATAKYKSTQDTFNFQVNYLDSFIKDKLTYRIDLGSTYTGIDKKGYTETGAGSGALARNQTVGKSSSKAVDLYAGFGLRHIFNTFDNGKKVTTIRTTGVYEFASEVYKKSHNSTKITEAMKALEKSATSDPASGKIRNKHIFQLNTSYLNRDVGVKFILGYEGIFYRNDKKARVQNHTGTLKMEYRW